MKILIKQFPPVTSSPLGPNILDTFSSNTVHSIYILHFERKPTFHTDTNVVNYNFAHPNLGLFFYLIIVIGHFKLLIPRMSGWSDEWNTFKDQSCDRMWQLIVVC
jgi:hypothetical protein